MTKHLGALAKAKAIVKLHEMDPIFKAKLEARAEEEEKEAKRPPGAKLLKEMAESDVYEEQREVIRKVQKAKSGTNQEKPA